MKLRKIELYKSKKGLMNKKASIIDILVWVAISFTLVMFFAVWIYGFNLVTEELQTIETNVSGSNLNISEYTRDTFGVVNTAQTAGLHTLAFVMIFISGVSILISNFLVKAHPAFFLVYLLVIIAAFISSVYVSNQYESLMTNEVIGETLSAFKGTNFIMLNLPVWVSVIGIFGAIFLFMGILRDYGMGGSVR